MAKFPNTLISKFQCRIKFDRPLKLFVGLPTILGKSFNVSAILIAAKVLY